MCSDILTILKIINADHKEQEKAICPRFTSLYDDMPLNKYSVEKQVGEGASADVWQCRSRSKGLRVIKFFKDKKQLTRRLSIENEIQIHHQLDHPSIIKLYEFGQKGVFKSQQGKTFEADIFYVVLEHAETSLLDHLEVIQKFDESQAKQIFIQLVSAIEYLHEKEIVHRDLKPQNILINSGEQIRVADFGLAMQGECQELDDYVGSKGYMCPEIEEGRPYNGKEADVFSLGVCLFNIVTGLNPFQRARLSDKNFKSLVRENHERFFKCFEQAIQAELSRELKDLMRSMLAYRGGDRPTIAEIRNHEWLRACEI